MSDGADVVRGFMQALGKGDFAEARTFLKDQFSFKGPFDSFDRAEPYIEALKRLYPIVDSVDMKKIFTDGNDTCVLYDMATKTVGTALIAEWYRVEGGKIASIRAVFDARPFAAMFAPVDSTLKARGEDGAAASVRGITIKPRKEL